MSGLWTYGTILEHRVRPGERVMFVRRDTRYGAGRFFGLDLGRDRTFGRVINFSNEGWVEVIEPRIAIASRSAAVAMEINRLQDALARLGEREARRRE